MLRLGLLPSFPRVWLRLWVMVTCCVGAVSAVGLAGCRSSAGDWGRVTILESRLGASAWSVVVDDQGQGVTLSVDGSPREARCRRIGQGIRCWVSGLRRGYRRLAVQVAGRGVARRTALSPAPDPADLRIYEVVLDRFADGDLKNNLRVRREDPSAPHGGDLAGLRERLPFLSELGVNAVLVSPIWDHARVGKGPGGLPAWLGHEPLPGAGALELAMGFGTPAELMRVLAAARRQGLRVLFDFPRPPSWPLSRYFEVVRTWVARTFVDGVRLGPPREGEERAWARETRSLAEAFEPFVVLHRAGTGEDALAEALAGLPPGARILEDRVTGEALLGWLGCGAAAAAAPPGDAAAKALGLVPRAASGSPRARVVSGVDLPSLKARCDVRSSGGVSKDRTVSLTRMALTTHLLLAEIPMLFYADGQGGSARDAPLPLLHWPEAERSWGHRLMRRVLSLRREVPALRRGFQRLRILGDTLIITRSHGACRAVVVVHRGEGPRRLVVPLHELGWGRASGGEGASVPTLELVEQLRGRGVAAEDGQLTLDLEPLSVSVLVPAGRDACRG